VFHALLGSGIAALGKPAAGEEQATGMGPSCFPCHQGAAQRAMRGRLPGLLLIRIEEGILLHQRGHCLFGLGAAPSWQPPGVRAQIDTIEQQRAEGRLAALAATGPPPAPSFSPAGAVAPATRRPGSGCWPGSATAAGRRHRRPPSGRDPAPCASGGGALVIQLHRERSAGWQSRKSKCFSPILPSACWHCPCQGASGVST
jgi:hypothetical protein